MTSKYHQRLGWLCLVTVIAETLLVILSWLLSAMRVEGVRSLLSSEGIRWFFSSFNDLIASPVLVWLLVLMCALGCLQKSRVTTIFGGKKSINFRDRLALYVALAFLLIYVVIILLLTLMPHAILLSATGHLFPSAFSRSLVPITAFGICIFSVAFGLMAGVMRNLSDILQALSFGIAKGAPLLVFYLFAVQLVGCLRFVFG
ncbi:MAG: AbgT family transporter [Prevotella sp.]|jgi:aminobenzoyl-glutamate transport protein|nr:AbgT family transporter [Prevotella sp.]MBQ6659712.1 AbgT family transporter [Prevotella sp.]